MPSISTPSANDPVSRAVQSFASRAGQVPVPLVATSYDIAIASGLADVAATRRFVNSEKTPIEAVLTFPLPVHAVLYALEAKIGDRVVKAVAVGRKAARERYEDALDRGKTAVLHEELIPGVHMLSVGQVAPGAEITVTARFAMALSVIEGRVLLRIPTTVGDIYGDSGLADSDELVHGGPAMAADIVVSCEGGQPELLGARLEQGRARVPLDVPIVVEIAEWVPAAVDGRCADGTGVSLSFAPMPKVAAPVAVSILVDHSGSMETPCVSGSGLSKHAAVLLGLTEAAAELQDGDRLDLWEFESGSRQIGTAAPKEWRRLLRQLSPPAGGTEIGGAISAVLATSKPDNVLLVTDGKSHALDVHALAKSARFTVVLIGEDSLDARVGHLAALSGGDIFVPAEAEVGPAIGAALQSMRAVRRRGSCGGRETQTALETARSGMTIRASWSSRRSGETASRFERAVGAYVAMLRLTSLEESDASKLAEAEGLVTHLTSLVLVDEAGVVTPGLAAMRKVALPTPATASPVLMGFGGVVRTPPVVCATKRSRSSAIPRAVPSVAMRSPSDPLPTGGGSDAPERYRFLLDFDVRPDRDAPKSAPRPASTPRDAAKLLPLRHLEALARRIDWAAEAGRLIDGDLSGLEATVAAAISQAAELEPVLRAAERLGVSALTLVIALVARAAGAEDRRAARVARRLLGGRGKKEVKRESRRLGL